MAGPAYVAYSNRLFCCCVIANVIGHAMESGLKTVLRWGVFALAVAVTTGWLVLSFAYLSRFGWDGLLSLSPGDLAASLSAAAGPPVALWLVLMVVSQKQELTTLRKVVIDLGVALRRGQEQAEIGSRALIELTSASERQAAQDGLALALDDLTSSAAVVAERLGVLDADGLDLAWARYGSGDRWAFLRPFLDRAAAEGDFAERLARALDDDVQAKLSAQGYTRRLSQLRSDNGVPAQQKLLNEILEDGPVAQVGRLFSPQEPATDQPDETSDVSADGVTEDIDSMDDRLGPQPTLFQPQSKSA